MNTHFSLVDMNSIPSTSQMTIEYAKANGRKKRSSLFYIKKSQKNRLRLQRESVLKRKRSIFTPIFDNLFKPGLDGRQKILWMLALLFSALVCLSQLTDRLHHYFSNPIVSDVSIERFETANFPPVILCKHNFESDFLYNLKKMIQKKCIQSSECNQYYNINAVKFYNFDKLGLNFTEIWDQNSIQKTNIINSLSCAGLHDKSICLQRKGLNVQFKNLDSYNGKCISISLNEIIEFHGASTYWQFEVIVHKQIAPLKPWESLNDIKFYVHSGELINDYEIYFGARNLLKEFKTDIHISTKIYQFLNTTEQPCFKRETVIRCKRLCFQQKLNNKISCRLPFMSNPMPLCNNLNETEETYRVLHNAYMSTKISECHCYRICNETKHLALMDVVPVNRKRSNTTKFVFYFTDGVIETVNEKYLYTFPALLSDIAGNLGFFLGLSVLTGLNYISKLVIKIYHFYTRKNKVVRMSYTFN